MSPEPHDEPHDDHGSTPAAWTAVIIMMVAVLIGGIAVVIESWPLFWIGGVALVVVGAIVGKVMQLMGYGATQADRRRLTRRAGRTPPPPATPGRTLGP